MGLFDFLFTNEPSKERPKLIHSSLGELEYQDEGWWDGKREVDGQIIEYSVEGTETEVYEDLAVHCNEILSNFSFYFDKSLKKIVSELSITETEARRRFSPDSLSGFWRRGDNTMFYFCFKDIENEYAIWRVQFDNGVPEYLGCDA